MKAKRAWRLFPEKVGPYPWIWMINITLPLYYLLQLPFHQAWSGFAAVLVLVVAYFRSLWNVGRARLLVYILLQIAAVGLLSAMYAAPFLFMEFFPAGAIGLLNSKKLMLFSSAVMTATSVFVLRLHVVQSGDDFWISFLPTMIILVVFPFMILSQRRSHKLRQELQAANEEITRLIKNEERQRIARDLHDTIGHTLTLITIKSELVERMIPRQPELAVQEAQEIHQTTRTALKQLRELISDMQSVDLQEELVQAERMLGSAGIKPQLAKESVPLTLNSPPIVRNILGMCLRECVTNVVKHSKARHCAISVLELAGAYILDVTDDGVGISSEGSRMGLSGSGLLGMKERLSLLEGRLDFLSPPGGGTSIRVTIPKVVKQQAAGVAGP